MKWFWIVIALLVIAAAALAIRSRSVSSGGRASVPSEVGKDEVGQRPSATSTPLVEEKATGPSGTEKSVATPTVNAALKQADTTSADTTQATAAATATSKEQPQEVRASDTKAPAVPVPPVAKDAAPKSDAATGAQEAKSVKPSSERAAEEAAAARALAEALDKALAGEEVTHAPSTQTPPSATPANAGGKADASTAAGSKPVAAAPAADAKPTLVTQPDGTVLVDGQFVIAGKGTRAEPYKIPWEMLVSAEKTYQPRLGRKDIPGRLTMLHDTWVTISGYIAFPLMAQSQDEMLMMLNQWDGCCIGVPPTPYDAIEVKLKTAAKGDERLKVTGAVTGKLKVDPYLVKDWLVSLYLMDEAELVTTGKAGAAPAKH